MDFNLGSAFALDVSILPQTSADVSIRHLIEALADEDGGGFVATVPDLPGCMSDGGTREEAARNVEDAIASWLEEARAVGRVIPEPRAALRIA